MRDEVLNCDAPGCGHVEHVGTITEGMVDMPCPKCGSNLLTLEDWISWQAFSALMNAVEEVVPDDSGSKLAMRVGLHGRKTRIEIEPVDNTNEGRHDV